MPSLLLPDLDDDLAERLRARAEAHGRTVEAEARDLLRGALAGEAPAADEGAAPPPPAPGDDPLPPDLVAEVGEGFGTRAARLFAGIGLTEDEYEMFLRGTEAHKREMPRGADFGE